MDFMKVKLVTFARHGRHGIKATEHAMRLPRTQAVKVAKAFYGGEGFTGVHDDTMAAFTPQERRRVMRRR